MHEGPRNTDQAERKFANLSAGVLGQIGEFCRPYTGRKTNYHSFGERSGGIVPERAERKSECQSPDEGTILQHY